MHWYEHVSAGARRGQKRASNHLGSELQVVVNHLTWLLGTEFQFSAMDISFAPSLILKEKHNNRIIFQ